MRYTVLVFFTAFLLSMTGCGKISDTISVVQSNFGDCNPVGGTEYNYHCVSDTQSCYLSVETTYIGNSLHQFSVKIIKCESKPETIVRSY